MNPSAPRSGPPKRATARSATGTEAPALTGAGSQAGAKPLRRSKATRTRTEISRSGAYIGRFAPSPTGPLHEGSLVAALASWLDASAQDGRWLVRIEDLDRPRTVAGAAQEILSQLDALGLRPDEAPSFQSSRAPLYQAALDRLVDSGLAYRCACSRREIEFAWRKAGSAPDRGQELVYPGSCRGGVNGRRTRSWRFRLPGLASGLAGQEARSDDGRAESALLVWTDRRLGPQQQDVAAAVGDFILLRADGIWAYQLAVVVDDAAQGVTHVVRGEDLADNTPRQVLLQAALGLSHPAYLHTALVLGPDGQKLSKQNGAKRLATDAPLDTLNAAARRLGLAAQTAGSIGDALNRWVAQWRAQHPLAR